MKSESTVLLEPYGFIYITTNMLNGKRYIGQKKWDTASRWRSYLGSGYYLMKDIEKYGKQYFIRDIVDYAFSLDELNKKERLWISNYDAVNSIDYYNAIDGGDVTSSITKCKPVINIDTNYIFKSIKDASLWSGCTYEKIKSTLNYVYDIKEPRKLLIFKHLEELELSHKMCALCAKNFKDKNQRAKYCESCRNSDSFRYKDSSELFIPSKNETLCFKKDDKWVINYLKTTLINTSMNYKNPKYKIINRNTETPKVNTRKAKNRKKINKQNNGTNLESYKDIIIKMYCSDKMNFSEISNALNLEGLSGSKVKSLLTQSNIEIRPNCYQAYKQHLKNRYFIVTNNNETLSFQFFFELKYWIEKVLNKTVTRSRVLQILNNNEHIRNFTIREINEDTFLSHKKFYKRVDEL